MSAAKKKQLETKPDEAWLAERVKDGRAVLDNNLSMKVLKTPDVRLQQRVEHLNAGHVARLDRMRIEGTIMYPIVVFWDETLDEYHLADGHHRHKMTLNAKLPSIRAYIIKGTWRDAMLYSVMCNQLAIMVRTGDDIKKAVFTLLDDEEWRGNSDQMIADHCGLGSSDTVARYRLEHSKLRNVPIPERVKSKDNKNHPYRKPRTPMPSRNTQGTYGAVIDGGYVRGPSKEQVQEKLDAIVSEKKERKLSLLPENLKPVLCRREVHVESASLGGNLGLGDVFVAPGLVLTSDPFDRTLYGNRNRNVSVTVGRILLARQLIDPTARAVVVCYVEDAPPELIEAGRALGVEFLTPEELVESLQNKGPVIS